MTEPFGNSQYQIWHCKECDAPLIQHDGAFGSVCPNGHGRIQAKLPTGVRRRNHAKLIGVQEVQTAWDGSYTLPEVDGTWKKVGTISKVLNDWPKLPEDQTLGLFDQKILVLERVT